jgi:hypothetical protein
MIYLNQKISLALTKTTETLDIWNKLKKKLTLRKQIDNLKSKFHHFQEVQLMFL